MNPGPQLWYNKVQVHKNREWLIGRFASYWVSSKQKVAHTRL